MMIVPVRGRRRARTATSHVRVRGSDYSPPEISAIVLQKMRQTAEDYLGDEVTEAVITVPAYFDDAQRQATKDAGQIAGLNVLRIVNEPTAAALAYGVDKEQDADDRRLRPRRRHVRHLDPRARRRRVPRALDRRRHVPRRRGLRQRDRRVHRSRAFTEQNEGIDLRGDRMALQRLKEAAERAKIELSSAQMTEINLPFFSAGPTGPRHLQMHARARQARELVEPARRRRSTRAARARGRRASTRARHRRGHPRRRQTRMPRCTRWSRRCSARSRTGASTPTRSSRSAPRSRRGVLTGEVKDVLLLDVTPLSLGVETMGGVMTRLIPRNTTIPARKSEIFSTPIDNQTLVKIHVLQGEREMADDNKSLGKFELAGIPPAPRGVPQIEVTFDIDANGILSVSAKDRGTGNEQKIEVRSGSGLSDAEINQMVQDAEAHADDDRRLRDLADARNSGESLIYSTEKSLRDHGDKVDEVSRTAIETAIADLRASLEGEDADQIRVRSQALERGVLQARRGGLRSRRRARPRPPMAARRRRASPKRRSSRTPRSSTTPRKRGSRRCRLPSVPLPHRHAPSLAPRPLRPRSGRWRPRRGSPSSMRHLSQRGRSSSASRPSAMRTRSFSSASPPTSTTSASGRSASASSRPLRPTSGSSSTCYPCSTRSSWPSTRSTTTRPTRCARESRTSHRALLAALERAGATTIDPYGSPFDPAEHEALLAQPDPTVDEGVVLQVHQRGFRLGDRVIRPARVVIAAAPAEGV